MAHLVAHSADRRKRHPIISARKSLHARIAALWSYPICLAVSQQRQRSPVNSFSKSIITLLRGWIIDFRQNNLGDLPQS